VGLLQNHDVGNKDQPLLEQTRYYISNYAYTRSILVWCGGVPSLDQSMDIIMVDQKYFELLLHIISFRYHFQLRLCCVLAPVQIHQIINTAYNKNTQLNQPFESCSL
jgi:hypothetical protein